MGIYKTYQDAVIANGSTKGVYTDDNRFYTDGTEGKYCDVEICNPADHLESMADFYGRGFELVDGDNYTSVTGKAYTVGVQLKKAR